MKCPVPVQFAVRSGRRLKTASTGLLLTALACFGVIVAPGRSQTPAPQSVVAPNPLPAEPPLDLKALEPGQAPAGVVTSTSISPIHLTIPSLWWVQDQIESLRRAIEREAILVQLENQEPSEKSESRQELMAKVDQLEEQQFRVLLLNWLAYPIEEKIPGRVDLIVDRQVWGGLDYLQRYAFVNRFSTISRSYGYNIRVFDNQANIVGAFTCDFSDTDLRLLQVSNEVAQLPGARPDLINYSRNPISDQMSCAMAIETGLGAFLRRRTTPLPY